MGGANARAKTEQSCFGEALGDTGNVLALAGCLSVCLVASGFTEHHFGSLQNEICI